MTASAELRSIAKSVKVFAPMWLDDAAELVDKAVTTQLNADTGGDGVLSNARRIGAATTKVTVGTNTASVKAAGAVTIWRWLEEGTGTHTIRARKGRALRTPAGPRRKVTVSGMRPKNTWTKGSEKGLVAAERAAFVDLERAVG